MLNYIYNNSFSPLHQQNVVHIQLKFGPKRVTVCYLIMGTKRIATLKISYKIKEKYKSKKDYIKYKKKTHNTKD